jgi:hypothetical protein
MGITLTRPPATNTNRSTAPYGQGEKMPEKIEVDYELFRELVDAAGWVSTFYSSLSQGETREYHPDWNSVEYLASEAILIEQRGRAVLEAVEQRLQSDKGKDAVDLAFDQIVEDTVFGEGA